MTTAPSKPSEVGWQFVSQYYTFVNKQPNRLHCFYTKNSAFIHGTEGEDGKPCYGQHEIHQKILSIGFQDCKVYIHSVDAQASANNGIIIQAIGEMSNNSEPWRKFAQTFFLAEQPNGYFVLNDIFRYLKEDAEEDEDQDDEIHPAEAEAVAVAASVVVDQELVPDPAPVVETNYNPNPQQQSRPEPPSALESQPAPTETHQEPVVPLTNGNGTHHQVPDSPPPAVPAEPAPLEPEERVPTPVPVLAPSPPPTPPPQAVATPTKPATPAPPAPIEEPPEASASVPTPAPVAPHVAEPVSVPAPAPKPVAPEKPKTWANLAASKPNAWGSNLAADSKGVVAAAAPTAPAPTPSTIRANGPQPRSTSASTSGPDAQGQSPAVTAALAITTPQCFVKGVTETVDQTNLRAVLTARFGAVKELEVVRSKACAFLEFEKLESAKKAIIASLAQHQGGEGGVRIGDGDPAVANYSRDAHRITVETRKERGDRPPSKPRIGAPPGGDRGGYRGVGRGRGTLRGSAPTNGAK